MNNLTKIVLTIFTFIVLTAPLKINAQEINAKLKYREQNNGEVIIKDKEKLGLRYRPSYSEDTSIAVKLNVLLAILMVNPAIEFKVMRNWTVQVEGI